MKRVLLAAVLAGAAFGVAAPVAGAADTRGGGYYGSEQWRQDNSADDLNRDSLRRAQPIWVMPAPAPAYVPPPARHAPPPVAYAPPPSAYPAPYPPAAYAPPPDRAPPYATRLPGPAYAPPAASYGAGGNVPPAGAGIETSTGTWRYGPPGMPAPYDPYVRR